MRLRITLEWHKAQKNGKVSNTGPHGLTEKLMGEEEGSHKKGCGVPGRQLRAEKTMRQLVRVFASPTWP